MNYFFLENWHDFLPREPGHVVAFMGSGGKTSLMGRVGERLAGEGVGVILTTTTRSEPLAGIVPRDPGADGTFAGPGPDGPWFARAGVTADGKWEGLAPGAVDDLVEDHPASLVLVEVDGSAKLPLKIHRPDEPVWPARTSLAVVVVGAAAVGRRAGEVVHRFGREACPALAGHEDWTLVEWDHAADLVLGEGGYVSRVPPGVPVVLALAGLGEQADSIGLFGFAGRAMEDPRLPLVMFCELAADPPSLRTACRDDGDGP
jgi:probable selenium-dependent hydroxylase accessory protein YqeC